MFTYSATSFWIVCEKLNDKMINKGDYRLNPALRLWCEVCLVEYLLLPTGKDKYIYGIYVYQDRQVCYLIKYKARKITASAIIVEIRNQKKKPATPSI